MCQNLADGVFTGVMLSVSDKIERSANIIIAADERGLTDPQDVQDAQDSLLELARQSLILVSMVRRLIDLGYPF